MGLASILCPLEGSPCTNLVNIQFPHMFKDELIGGRTFTGSCKTPTFAVVSHAEWSKLQMAARM